MVFKSYRFTIAYQKFAHYLGDEKSLIVTRLLFIDNSSEMLEHYQSLFSETFEVHCCLNFAEAIEFASEHQIDVMISDQHLSSAPGYGLLLKIKTEHQPDAEGILITSTSQNKKSNVVNSPAMLPFKVFHKNFQLFELFDYIHSKYCVPVTRDTIWNRLQKAVG